MSAVLHTDRLTVRPVNMMDFGMLQRLLADPDDCLRFGCDPFEPQALTSRIVRHTLCNTTGAGFHWVIERRDLRLPIGFCDAYPPPSHLASLQYADISYGLDPLYRGQGYMQEALAACLGHLINVAQFKRIEATVNPENTASYKLLESLGFQSEGIQRQKGVWGGQRHDMLGYALLAGELIAPPA